MPSLPLPPLQNGVPLDAGQLAVETPADVSKEWSQDLMASQQAPIRDAIIQAQTNASLKYQNASRYAACQNDRLRATGEYLQEIGGELGITKRQGETDAAYRARVNSPPAVVDPNDVIAVANAVLAPFTSISCRYAERSDGWFVNAGDPAWSSHVYCEPDRDSVTGGTVYANIPSSTPNYPDRLYALANPAPSPAIPNRRPPGAMVNADSYGRWFLLRAPDISLVDSTVAAAYAGDASLSNPSGLFVSGTIGADGVNAQNASFLFNFSSTVDTIYASLVAAVEQVRMHSVRWSLYVDPNLAA